MALSIPSSDEKRGNFIGGAFVPPQAGQYEPCRNPADIRDVLGLYPRSAVGDARAAVDAACAAFPSCRTELPTASSATISFWKTPKPD